MTTKIKSGVISDNAITSAHISSGAISSAHLTGIDTDAVSEGSSNLYFTTARVDSHLSGGTGVTYSSGAISIGQSVATTDSPTFANLTLTGNLNITGDVDSVSVTDLDVTDKTITVGVGGTASANDGAGIVVDGASASILWDNSNGEWDINKPINVTGRIVGTGVSQFADVNIPDNNAIRFGSSQDLQIFHNSTDSIIYNGTGALMLRANDFRIQAADASSTKMLIDSSGNVGIGTSSPSYPLHVDRGSTGDIAHFEGQGSVHLRIGEASNVMYLNANNGNAAIAFRSNDSEKMRINSSGNVGIGTSSPSYPLQVQIPSDGSIGASFRYTGGTNNPGLFFSTNESTTVSSIDASGSTTGILAFATGGTERMRITSDGTLLLGQTTANANAAVFELTGKNSTQGTIRITPDSNKGSEVSHIHHGSTGDWYIRSASTSGKVIINDAGGNVGIGTSSPSAKLHVEVADNTEFLKATITGNESWAFKGASGSGATDYVSFGLSGSTQCMTWQENGYVGIGTQSPATALEVNNFSAGDTVATFEGSYGSGGDVQLVRYERSGGAVYGAISYKDATTDMEFGNISSHNLSFTTGNTRRMTIMTNGGVEIGDGTNYGYVKVINNSAVVQYLDRRGTDGAVLEIRHADAKDGQINTLSGRMAVGSDDTGLFFDSTRDCISPFTMTGNDGRGDLIDIGRTGVKFKDIHLSGDVYFGDNLHFNAASDSSFIGPSSTTSIKYAADGAHLFQTYNGAWGTVLQIQDTGLYLEEGNYAYHNEVPEFAQHSVNSYSSSTNVTYNESTSNVPDKGEKLVAVSHARAYTNYIHFKTNLSANNIMHYFRTRGYFYGSGMEEKVHGAYTYNNTVISLEHQSVYGGTHTLTVYKSSDGYLVLRLHANQTGYTEGKVYVYFSAHSHQVTRELEITSVIQRDDGNNAF